MRPSPPPPTTLFSSLSIYQFRFGDGAVPLWRWRFYLKGEVFLGLRRALMTIYRPQSEAREQFSSSPITESPICQIWKSTQNKQCVQRQQTDSYFICHILCGI
jgi:hypothetical protein